jgi:hypothetical protein
MYEHGEAMLQCCAIELRSYAKLKLKEAERIDDYISTLRRLDS